MDPNITEAHYSAKVHLRLAYKKLNKAIEAGSSQARLDFFEARVAELSALVAYHEAGAAYKAALAATHAAAVAYAAETIPAPRSQRVPALTDLYPIDAL